MEDGDSDTDKYPHRNCNNAGHDFVYGTRSLCTLREEPEEKFPSALFYSLVTGYAYIQTRLQPHVNILRINSLRKISHRNRDPSLCLIRTSDAANLSIIPEKMQEKDENLFLA